MRQSPFRSFAGELTNKAGTPAQRSLFGSLPCLRAVESHAAPVVIQNVAGPVSEFTDLFSAGCVFFGGCGSLSLGLLAGFRILC
jgi:hypothetical protein